MSDPLKVGIVTFNLVNNGVTGVVMNYATKLVEAGNEVTILVGGCVDVDKGKLAMAKGIEIVELPSKKNDPVKYLTRLSFALKYGCYDIVHVHGNSGMILPDLLTVREFGSSVVVSHCHSTECDHPRLHKLLRPFVPLCCDARIACSQDAGKWLYKQKDYFVLPNAFETERFRFSVDSRCSFRERLHVADSTLLLGTIARLNPEKNHGFLVEVFESVHDILPDSKLLIVGDGPMAEEVSQIVAASPAREDIILYGNEPHAELIYPALDVFLLPSHHEGLPLVSLEAQISGLPCFFSEAVPEEARLCSDMHVVPLQAGVSGWVDSILNCEVKSDAQRSVDSACCNAARFDIEESYALLENIYELSQKKRPRLAEGWHK
ncbi:glycosyltransferase [Alistipes putredinis]|uniref:glycosyltransferase n=1 Tax=Alistipes putredinis TaxID=28117 RepID=UPI003A8A672D